MKIFLEHEQEYWNRWFIWWIKSKCVIARWTYWNELGNLIYKFKMLRQFYDNVFDKINI